MIIASQTEKLGFTRCNVPRTERLVKVNWQIAGDAIHNKFFGIRLTPAKRVFALSWLTQNLLLLNYFYL